MTKQTGLGDCLLVGGVDLSGDTTSIDKVGGGPSAIECTGIDKSGMERLGGLVDGGIDWTSWWNPTGAHPVLSELPDTSAVVAYSRGLGLGLPGAAILAKRVTYDPKRANDGALTMSVTSQCADGYPLSWGTQATPGIRTDITGGNGVALDNGASSNNGLIAHLSVLGVTGTSVTVKLQDSPDNAAWTDVTGGGFAAATGAGGQRIETATGLTVERYLRVVTSGTFTEAVVHVIVERRVDTP